MRFFAAILGVLVSILPLIFFWVGAQTFLRPLERGLAIAMFLASGALLLLSIALLVTPSVQRLQAMMLVITFGAVAAIFIAYQLTR